MKISREQVQLNHDAIVAAAARLFRERGIAATGVADVTRAAGMTHGGFYARFPEGKEGLAVEALQRAFDDRRQIWAELAQDKSADQALRAIADAYLSPLHLESLGDGCPVPPLATDASRMTPAVRAAFSQGVSSYLDELQRHAAGDDATARQTAARQLATMAGAMLLARAVDDPALAQTFLAAARAQR